VDGTLVRGLDYYTRTVFEFESTELGAQSALGGGGRYDGLVERLGGPATPGVGWAAGIERILLASSAPDDQERRGVYVAIGDPERLAEGFALTRELRALGVVANIEQAGRSLNGQLKHADRLGAARVVIFGDGAAVEVRDLATGVQRTLASPKHALELIGGESR
jgi:histidyl-tRNA synthetase